MSAHERGYRLARRRDDQDAAARLAVQLAIDAYSRREDLRGERLDRAGALLTERRVRARAVRLRWRSRAHVPCSPATIRSRPSRVQASAGAARAAGSTDVESSALALEGLALVCGGSVDEGMRRLDAATAAAVAGEVGDVDLAETICCYLIDACKRVRDLDRAAEWCSGSPRSRAGSTIASCSPSAACTTRTCSCGGRLGRGRRRARDRCGPVRRAGGAKIADSTVRLAELRRRQGRLDEAAELLAAVRSHRLHALHAGLLALDLGEPAEALDAAARFLRRIGNGDRFERVAGLELLVRRRCDADCASEAAEAAAEIRATADAVGTRAATSVGARRGGARGGSGRRSSYRARRLRGCRSAFEAAGAPYEAAQAWLESGRGAARGRRGGRGRSRGGEGRRALASLGVTAGVRSATPAESSPAEREVLALVAQGRSNDEIAAALVLSVRTVERHVANTYRKLRLSGRSARAAAASWAHAHGIT